MFVNKQTLYIHTPGYEPTVVDTELMLMNLTGKLPYYGIYKYKDGSIHLVHDDYERYVVKLYNTEYTFTKRDAIRSYRNNINSHPNSLVEFYVMDWEGKCIEYDWHKKFMYGKFRKLKIPAKVKSPEHPFKQYFL
jgi:hypothetical protein